MGTDAHKWLNVPYDSGLAFCRDADAHAAAMSYTAAYLTGSGGSDHVLGDVTPESSRRARGFAVWAAFQELGRRGVADLVDRSCAHAQHMADLLAAGGATIYNDVVLNQVLVGFGDLSGTDAVVEAVQRDGTCWLGATTWQGRRLIRISVSNWTTTEADIERLRRRHPARGRFGLGEAGRILPVIFVVGKVPSLVRCKRGGRT